MPSNETNPPLKENTMNTDKYQSWPKPAPAPTTSTEDFGNGIFINWKI